MNSIKKIEKIFKIPTKETVAFIPPNRQSPEEVSDFSVKKVVNTREGTIEKTPVNGKDIVNKDYADSLGSYQLLISSNIYFNI